MKRSPVYDWSVEEYINLVENTQNPILKAYEQAEIDYILAIPDLPRKTVIDVGAGYGRILPHIAPIARNVIAVDINDSMFSELQKRATLYPNTTAVKGDANDLSSILKDADIISPVLVCLQNSIGTWEGDYKKALSEIGKVARVKQGEVIISVWRQEGFKKHAIDLYNSTSALVGEPNLEQTDFENGMFRSKTGYLSKWWKPEEQDEIARILGGKKVKEVLGPAFFILHVSYI